MTSTMGEGELKNVPIFRTNNTDKLREMRMKGGGVIKSEKFADVIFWRPLGLFKTGTAINAVYTITAAAAIKQSGTWKKFQEIFSYSCLTTLLGPTRAGGQLQYT